MEKTASPVVCVNCVFSPSPFSLLSLLSKKATRILYNKHPDNAAVYAFCHKDSFYLHVTGIQTNRIMTIVATCVTWADIQHVGNPSTTAFQRVCSVVFFTREMLSCSHAVKACDWSEESERSDERERKLRGRQCNLVAGEGCVEQQ